MLTSDVFELQNLNEVTIFLTEFSKLNDDLTKQMNDGHQYMIDPRIAGFFPLKRITGPNTMALLKTNAKILYPPIVSGKQYDFIVFNKETKRPAFLTSLRPNDLFKCVTGKTCKMKDFANHVKLEPVIEVYLQNLLNSIKATA